MKMVEPRQVDSIMGLRRRGAPTAARPEPLLNFNMTAWSPTWNLNDSTAPDLYFK